MRIQNALLFCSPTFVRQKDALSALWTWVDTHFSLLISRAMSMNSGSLNEHGSLKLGDDFEQCMNFKEKGETLAPSSVFHFQKTITSRLIGPLQLVLHVVQKRRAGEQGTHALGQDKQRSRIIKNVYILLFVFSQCVSCPTAWQFCTT